MTPTASLPSLFVDGVVDAHVMHGVARITLGQAGGDGKPVPAGLLIVSIAQLPVLANGLLALLRQIEAKLKENQAAAPAASTPSASTPPEEAFRFNG